jgi:hypothetical protein
VAGVRRVGKVSERMMKKDERGSEDGGRHAGCTAE